MNVKDVKRCLAVAFITKDRHDEPLFPSKELIIVPHSVLDELVTALHVKLEHPSKHQLQQVMKRHCYALDMNKAIKYVNHVIHASLSKHFPDSLIKQSTGDHLKFQASPLQLT